MSHHQDSAAAKQDPRLDISDVYLFKGRNGTVFVMNTNPVSADKGFHPEALYEFHIDTDNDAVQDLTFRFRFLAPEPDGRQAWVLDRLTGAEAADRNAPGTPVATGSTEEIVTTPDGLKAFVGRAGDPFYLDGTVITAVVTALRNGEAVDLSAFDPQRASNLFAGTNVTAIVLEVPDDLVGSDTIGLWTTTALDDHHGGWLQINRCAKPLVSTLFDVTEAGFDDYNATDPRDDLDNYGDLVRRKVAALVSANDTHSDPQGYGAATRDIIFPDVLHYQVGTEAGFGAKARNGRGLTESVPEAMFEIVLNAPVSMGLDAGYATGTLRAEFPYLSAPA
ncbi:DUF4331 family protein [Streptomyces sp. MBT65]|uniref:DUF4331 family protein n=1 Tax=Streptomyces sp. MBT65 TaxID=1488395 RepID=UPI00190BDCF2|nr:DUF4331 family protein [Streptomyces sp. MBT65]MBK3574541.1 DUF4331 family protein [Streptomyces sp. MBT65]